MCPEVKAQRMKTPHITAINVTKVICKLVIRIITLTQSNIE